MPAPRTGLIYSVPRSGAPTPDQNSSTAVADTPSSDGGAFVDLRRCLALLEAAVDSAPGELAVAGFREAADFADVAEEISRRVEQLQLLSAAAVDRTRTTAINAAGPASKATGWTTGWGTEPEAPGPRRRPDPRRPDQRFPRARFRSGR